MADIKNKIMSLDKDKIHIIALKSADMPADIFKNLSEICNNIGLKAILIAVKDPDDIKVEEIGKIDLVLKDGKVAKLTHVQSI